MGFQTVCISHTDGARAESIGRAVAERLGFRYLNEEIIVEASRLAQVDPAVVAKAEQKQSFLQRILDSLSSAQEVMGSVALSAGFAVPVPMDAGPYHATKEDLRSMICSAILEVQKSGKAVIGAHAASLALAGKPGVLRILVTAPDQTRCERVASDRSLSADDAAELVAKGDDARREYMRTFYDVDDELPTRYDLVLNTEVLTPDEVCDLIVRAAGRA